MPAYFSLSFQYKKSNLNENTVRDFYIALLECGLDFKSGYYETENDTFLDIILWNKKKLDENFELGYDEHCSHDYKQMLFNYNDFSEVRLFMFNIEDEDTFYFYLIIPEEDFILYEEENEIHKIVRLKDRMKLIEDLAINMWEKECIECIQTGWECSDMEPSIEDIIKGYKPCIEPFCIVPERVACKDWACSTSKIGRNGIFLKNDDNWFYL